MTTLALLVSAAGAAGCGRPVLRIADPSLGDYYTAREFRRLRGDQRDEYCAELARQDSIYRAALVDMGEALGAIEARRAAAGAVADSLDRLADSLEARVAETRAGAVVGFGAGGEPAEGAGGAGVHTVRAGDSLWRIAAGAHGYGDGRRWRRIYEANRERIRTPDLIYPGQEIRIPR